ncbi:MAG: alpha/beta fold hydrolase [Dehalococcoidia bacterium]|nr:MAG: alpha/beta fold hydrolase [Dehalococcoidia bacterium]
MSTGWKVGIGTVVVVVTMTVGMWFTIAYISADAILNPSPPRELPFLAEQMFVAQAVEFSARDGVRIGALWVPTVAPAGAEMDQTRQPTIILLHGYGETRDSLLPQAELIVNAGFNALIVDFRGHGTSAGEVAALGTLDANDVLGAVDYLVTRPDVDISRIGIQGVSMGAAAGVIAAAQDLRVRAVIAEEPVSSLRDAVWTAYRDRLSLPAFLFRDVTLWLVERRLGEPLSDVSPTEAAARLTPRPLLVIDHEGEAPVEPGGAERLLNAAGVPKDLWVSPVFKQTGEGSPVSPAYATRVLAFWRASFGLQP